jgi:hypothetical protein
MKRMRKGFIVPAITWLIAVALVFSMESAAQAPESDSPPPAQLVLLPPENAAAACSKDVFNELTKRYRSCAIAFYDRKDPSKDSTCNKWVLLPVCDSASAQVERLPCCLKMCALVTSQAPMLHPL